jgi:hypothetical protein
MERELMNIEYFVMENSTKSKLKKFEKLGDVPCIWGRPLMSEIYCHICFSLSKTSICIGGHDLSLYLISHILMIYISSN